MKRRCSALYCPNAFSMARQRDSFRSEVVSLSQAILLISPRVSRLEWTMNLDDTSTQDSVANERLVELGMVIILLGQFYRRDAFNHLRSGR